MRQEEILIQDVEHLLDGALNHADGEGSPPRLAAALRYALMPGGARIRPRLALSVSRACTDQLGRVDPMSLFAAASIEIMHCASLVHDDLPAFDNAELRRGKPALHRHFDERIAILTGDALIVMAFQVLSEGCEGMTNTAGSGARLAALVALLSEAVGAPRGIAAGQAWECEPHIELSSYHESKTGALFAAATMMGAASAGVSQYRQWADFGQSLGSAFQIADDIRDMTATAEDIGKPVGQDIQNGAPNAAQSLGLSKAVDRLQALIERALATIPDCPRRDWLIQKVRSETEIFVPASLRRREARSGVRSAVKSSVI